MNNMVIRAADRVALIIVAALCAVFVAMAWGASTAFAEIDGPCGATVNGIDVNTLSSSDKGDAIKVDKGGQVALTMSSAVGFQSHKIELDYFGQKLPGDTNNDNGDTTFADFVNVDDYATAGVGLYKVYGTATLTDGTSCSGAVLIDVQGNPLTTVVGAVGAGAAAVGTVGAAAGLAASAASKSGGLGDLKDWIEDEFKETRERVESDTPDKPTPDEAYDEVFDVVVGGAPAPPFNPFPLLFGCLGTFIFTVITLPVRLPFMAISPGNGGGAPPARPAQRRRLPRARWTPRITLLGLISGIIAGAGGAILLQQYSGAIATRSLLVEMLIAGAVVYGLVIPTIGRTIAVMRVNARASQLEKRLGR
jgi:hypothetical protein